ncbi:MAG: roadblock/LC7 domain-containing protein [Candidatus Njordarchaeales archaeon]
MASQAIMNLMKKEIENLLKINREIENIIIATHDGIPIVSSVEDPSREALLASIAAIVKSLGLKINTINPSGEFNYALVTFSAKRYLIMAIRDAVILVIAKETARMGILIRDIRSFSNRIAQYIT